MSSIVAIGDATRVEGFALAGVQVLATDARDPVEAWGAMPDDVALVLLTRDAATALEDRLDDRSRLLWVVLPS